MDDLNPSDRLALSYPVPENFRRPWIYLLCALVLFFACIFVTFPANTPVVVSGRASPAGSPLLKMMAGFVSAAFMLSAISDAIFLLMYKYFKEEISFDQTNLYIDFKESESAGPLGNISAIEFSAIMIQRKNLGSEGTE